MKFSELQQIVESNSRAIQAMLDAQVSDRLQREELREAIAQLAQQAQQATEERAELRRATIGIANLLSSLDEDRPTVLRKLNVIEGKIDRILERQGDWAWRSIRGMFTAAGDANHPWWLILTYKRGRSNILICIDKNSRERLRYSEQNTAGTMNFLMCKYFHGLIQKLQLLCDMVKTCQYSPHQLWKSRNSKPTAWWLGYQPRTYSASGQSLKMRTERCLKF